MKEFLWIEFYTELADKLLTYKNNREALIEKIKSIYNDIGLKLPTLETNNDIVDIDPFTIFALFNKGITNKNRIDIINGFKNKFSITAETPKNFDGIPVVNNMKAAFYKFKEKRDSEDINNLWILFEKALQMAENRNAKTEADFVSIFNTIITQKGVSWNITMGLYWIRPLCFINLDAKNRKLLENNYKRFPKQIDIIQLLKNMPSGEDYINIISATKDTLTEYKSFPEISYDAWKQATEDKDTFYGEKEFTYWPSLEEYNPGITTEMWAEILNDKSLTSPEMLDMLNKILQLGGESSCYNLAKVFGKTHNYYNMMGSNFGKRIKTKYNLPNCYDEEYNTIRYYVIPFVGRSTKTHYLWKLRDELKEALEKMDLSEISFETNNNSFDKNIILYGPPGTGKTYNTANYAVAIIENKTLEEVILENHDEVLRRYNQYKEQGRIEFTTFHQSFGYEEFIEGIKPIVDDNFNIVYDVVPGVFKAFCDKISLPEIKGTEGFETNDYPTIWKVSLEGTGKNPTRTECLEKGHIRIGYDEQEDATSIIEKQEIGHAVLNRFFNEMSIGDIVISCFSASTIDAIGIVTGEPEFHQEYPNYKRLRKVKWLVKGIEENIVSINNGKKLSNPSIHRVNITLTDIVKIIERNSGDILEEKPKGNYVFIVDEINRGNISKILGELITLIEPKKRLGQDEATLVKLPYSQKDFGIPDNVYIIGTMNTADRSIAAIDTALRRRFSFKEMLPKPDLLEKVFVNDICIGKLLEIMNKRIEILYDREHTIGHAYFLPLKNDNSINTLANIFRNQILPLLQEYFYENYDRIRLILGDNQKENQELAFIKKELMKESELFGSDIEEIEETYRFIINEDAFTNIEAYKKLAN